MPIYEYLCGACGHAFEAIQKFSDPVLTDCPTCSKPELKKQLSAPGFQLKGSGWYATDFRGNGKKKDKADGDAKSETAPEAKPAGCGSGGCGCH